MVAEKNVDVQELAQLGFGKCRLCVQAPTADKITDVKQLCGKRKSGACVLGGSPVFLCLCIPLMDVYLGLCLCILCLFILV